MQIFAYEYVDSSIYEEVAMNFLDSQYSTNHISYDNLTVKEVANMYDATNNLVAKAVTV